MFHLPHTLDYSSNQARRHDDNLAVAVAVAVAVLIGSGNGRIAAAAVWDAMEADKEVEQGRG